MTQATTTAAPSSAVPQIDREKLHEFMGKMIVDHGAAALGPLVILGDKLGLYKKLADHGPLSSIELAQRTDTRERYIREWLAAQAAAGYITYDELSDKFSMSPEQAWAFASEESPVFLAGGFHSLISIYTDEEKLEAAYRSGAGVDWGDHNGCLFCGTEKLFKTSYRAHLTEEWLPALDGAVEKLTAGATVADVGCGHGASTIIMAQRFPKSKFIGYDIHEPSIETARERAREAGVTNVTFEVASAQDFNGDQYDLICFFDCLHDMGDPVGAIANVRQALKEDGSLMIVEPFAHDNLTDNFNPLGRLYYAFSAQVCVPCSLAQNVGLGLGAQAGEKRIAEVVAQGGLSRFRRATETPLNLIFEARR
ncbi:MAG TPA: class I SAM-dependent methyltransferase [candidate division Zixibacteria bacterium]|nr:class I SAM-dependent methyltransferase [candidate division Zixibacteria bacterium]